MSESTQLRTPFLDVNNSNTKKGSKLTLCWAMSGWLVAAGIACAYVYQHIHASGASGASQAGGNESPLELTESVGIDGKINCRWLLLLLIRVAGFGQLLLVVSSAAIPFLLDYKKELGQIQKPLLKQMFLVYSGYILMINFLMGLLSAFAAESILEVGFLPSVIVGFIFLYWFARLMIAIFVFDLSFLDRPHEILGRVGIETLFTGLPLIYGIALLHNLGKISLNHSVPDIGPFGRMMVIIIGVFGIMKICVYMMPKSNASALTCRQKLLFFFAWPGMQPARFLERKKGLDWKKDLAWGTFWSILGVAYCFGIKYAVDAGLSEEWAGLLALPAVSMMGHIGAFRLLQGAHRAVGYDVEQLFIDPLLATSMSDFWGKRWNIAFSDMNRFVFVAAVRTALEEDLKISKATSRTLGVFAAFVASAILHELGITAPVLSGFGGPSLYFLIQGFLVVVEKTPAVTSWREKHPTCAWLLALIGVAAPFPICFVVAFRTQIALPLTLFVANLPQYLIKGELMYGLCHHFGTPDICSGSTFFWPRT